MPYNCRSCAYTCSTFSIDNQSKQIENLMTTHLSIHSNFIGYTQKVFSFKSYQEMLQNCWILDGWINGRLYSKQWPIHTIKIVWVSNPNMSQGCSNPVANTRRPSQKVHYTHPEYPNLLLSKDLPTIKRKQLFMNLPDPPLPPVIIIIVVVGFNMALRKIIIRLQVL